MKTKTQKPEHILVIERYVEEFHKEHKCDVCDGSPDAECDNCGDIGYIPITPTEVELLLIKYRRKQLNEQLAEKLVEGVTKWYFDSGALTELKQAIIKTLKP